MRNVRDAGFSRKRDGNVGAGPLLPDPDKRAFFVETTDILTSVF